MKLFQRSSIQLPGTIIISLFYFATAHAQTHTTPDKVKSEWVYFDPSGKLVYKTLERGDRITDFSHAGYRGGGVRIPSPPVKITLHPLAGDNTDAIQQAIDKVSAMSLVNGFRGAVLLAPGTYDCKGTLSITAGGVVLRGSGSGENGTVLNMTGRSHACIRVTAGPGAAAVEMPGPSATITDDYVPSGTDTFTLSSASGFAEGDTIRITRPVTPKWVQFMGMDTLVRDGKKQTWVKGDITTERNIKKITGNRITVDVPLTDSYDAKYTRPPGVTVAKVSLPGEISGIGLENFRIVSPARSVTISEGHNRAFTMGRGVTDSWARNLEIFNTVNSISITGKRITVDNVSILHEVPTIGAAKPADLNGSGYQILFNRCRITGDNLFFFATGAKVCGPVVLLNCVFKGHGWIQPHQRWATGVLVDGCDVPGGGIDFMNRGSYGSGHGWAIGWSVAWNCEAQSLLNQQPPGSANWMIGCRGERQRKAMPFNKKPLLPEGIYDACGKPVRPASLYLAQLSERLGKQALHNIGY